MNKIINKQTKKSRPIKTFIILYSFLILTLLTTLGYLSSIKNTGQIPSAFILAMYLLKLIGLIFLIKWRKLGLYIFYISYILLIIYNFNLSLLPNIIIGIGVNILLFYIALKKQWSLYK